MKTLKRTSLFLTLVLMLTLCESSLAQLVVNGKDLNNDENLEYIQLMFYIDKATIKPVFYVDDGFIEPEYNEILEPRKRDNQNIVIDGEKITDRVTVVWVLNKMNKAGWEYMGDVVFVPLRVMNNWHVYTLRRK